MIILKKDEMGWSWSNKFSSVFFTKLWSYSFLGGILSFCGKGKFDGVWKFYEYKIIGAQPGCATGAAQPRLGFDEDQNYGDFIEETGI